MEDIEIPDNGAVFAFGKNQTVPDTPSKFWIKNDMITDIACGHEHTMVLTDSGRVFAIGNNEYGQLGLQNQTDAERPQRIKALKHVNIVKIACGTTHTIATTDSGLIYAWGANGDGQLGVGDGEEKFVPFEVIQVTTAPIELAAGAAHSMLLTDDGQVWTWGGNVDGQLGVDAEISYRPLHVSIDEKIVHIACGAYHSLALTEDGQVYGWGDGSWGQLGGVSEDPKKIEKPVLIPLSEKIVMLAAGKAHTLLLTEKGEIMSSGVGSYGQLGRGEDIVSSTEFGFIAMENKFIYISAHDNHSAAISDNGFLFTWGSNTHGELCLGRTNSNPQFSPILIPRLGDVVSFYAVCGGVHTMVLGRLRSDEEKMSQNHKIPIKKSYRLLHIEKSSSSHNIHAVVNGNVYSDGELLLDDAQDEDMENSEVHKENGVQSQKSGYTRSFQNTEQTNHSHQYSNPYDERPIFTTRDSPDVPESKTCILL